MTDQDRADIEALLEQRGRAWADFKATDDAEKSKEFLAIWDMTNDRLARRVPDLLTRLRALERERGAESPIPKR